MKQLRYGITLFAILLLISNCTTKSTNSNHPISNKDLHNEVTIEEVEQIVPEKKIERENLIARHESDRKKPFDFAIVKGELVQSSPETGLPYWHNFLLISNDDDTISFNFEGGKYEGHFNEYENLNCEVTYFEEIETSQIAIGTMNSEGVFDMEEDEYTPDDYKKHDSFEGVYVAESEAGDLPVVYHIKNDDDELELLGWPDMEKNGERVIVYYWERNRIHASEVYFPTLDTD